MTNPRKIDDYGFPLSPYELMCEAKSCSNKATKECEQIPGTAAPGWESEPTARCDEHSKGLIVLSELNKGDQKQYGN